MYRARFAPRDTLRREHTRMSPDEIKAVRKALGVTQRDLAELMELEVALVRDWEKGDRFPTKAHCDKMEALRKDPPPRKKGRARSPMELLADAGFYTVLRKLLAHAELRAEVEKLAVKYADPLDEGEDGK